MEKSNRPIVEDESDEDSDAGFRAGDEDVDSMIDAAMPVSSAVAIHRGATADATSLAPAQLVKAIGQKAYDTQLARFNPYRVPDTRMNLSINPEFIEKAAYIHGALDSIRWIRKHAVVFVVNGIADLCNSTIRELLGQPTSVEEAEAKGVDTRTLFHIDNWFVEKRNRGDLNYDPTDANTDLRFLQDEEKLSVNWIDILIKQELERPGFVRLLCSALEMEDRVLNQIAQRRAAVQNFGGVASNQRPTPHGY
jgi:hypothetical protein